MYVMLVKLSDLHRVNLIIQTIYVEIRYWIRFVQICGLKECRMKLKPPVPRVKVLGVATRTRETIFPIYRFSLPVDV